MLSVAPNETASSVAERIGAYPRVAEEIALWSQVLQDLTGCDGVGVRLARVDHAMCPRFHVDRVTLRVVVTYHGPGSEFVSNENVIRSHPNGARAANEPPIAVSDAAVVQQAQTLDVVFLKGEAWPDNTGQGAVRRSPFASKELPRLVLTLDPMMSV